MNNRILIVDDHPAISLAIRFLLASEGFDVVAEVDNGADALKMVDELCPSIIILDIGIPIIDGLTVISRIVTQKMPVKIIVLTGLSPAHLMKRCRQLGAHGFVSKQRELSELVYAVRAVRGHQEYFPDRYSVQAYGGNADREDELLELLSAREFCVMQQLLQRMSNKEIARSMQLSEKTVSTYKTRLLHKLKVSTLVELYALAKLNGFA